MGFISKLSLVVIILIAQIAAQVIFSENFEGSTSGWTVSPATNGWEFGTPTVGPASTPEGVRCAGTILNGQYINHANYSMTSPSITLPSNTPFNLTYYSWLGRETCCDHASLEIERNGTWTRVNYDSGSTSWRLITTNIDSYSGSTIRLRFTFTSDVSSVNYGWYVDDIRISQIPSVNLTIQNDLNGSATPSGIVSVRSNSPCTISATPNTNFRFDKWSIISGSPVIGDSFSTPTTVTTSTESSIRANFKPCTVYTITTTPQQYNYNQNYYTSITNGVRFKFTAPMTGTFGVTFQNVSSYTNYIYYYGRDSLFTTSVRSNTNSSTITMTITANTGENHYFRVYTSSSYYNRNFNIYYSPPVTLTVSKSGSGWTSPSGTVEVLSGAATSISAVSSGGYLFQNWTAVRGNPVIASATSATTSVTATADSSEIRANFIINPNTRPNTQISDINISSHPDICLTASVTDSAGRSITGLDTNNFILTQDSDTVPFQLSTVSNIAGVSVSLVIDISGSMDTDLPAAKEAALQYVRSMGPLDRCAIVSFDDVVTVEQTITSDTSLLIPAISRLTYDGRTAIINGAYTGVQQLLQETNTSAVIIYSDGLDNESTTPLATAINLAKQNSIRIYSIGLGSSADRSILGALADSTGGYYTYSPTAAGLASIYAQIKSDVQAQYILCYQTPDAIFNGDTHQVVLSVSLNNSTSKDTVYWNENNSPPVITLTSQTEAMIGVNQTPNQPLTISADVTDDGTVQQVRFFYRRSGTTAGAFTEVSMTYISGSLYQYIVPAAQVILPGIDFYILATDNYNIIGRSPNVLAPETQPYVIPVSNDVPVIAHTQPSCVTPSLDQTISSTITDQNGIFIALLYFKRGNETFYTIDTMSLSGSATYSGTIPASMIGTNGIDYYFRAIDNIGAAVRYQRSGSIHLSLCNISNPPVANAGLDQTLFTDNSSCVVTATLDGTASTNPDGGTLTYSWTGPFTGSLPGATPSVNLDTGTNQIILNVSNGAGLIDLDTVIITVRDTLPPAFSQATLSDITAQCSVTLPIPTATDNCGGVINGTTPITTFDTQGTFSVEWTYRDPSGNTSRQLQNVIIDDNTPPVPDQPQLLTITSTCGVELTPPTATDSCSGKIAATTSSPLSINNQGTYTITWTYDDGNGNTETQDQTVIIKDSIPPVFAALSDRVITTKSAVSGANLTVETARATDNCTQVSVQGVRSDALRLDTLFFEGATRITWTACDTNNNCSYASQTITVIRNRAPALQIPTDTSLSEGEILTFSVSASDTDGTIPFLFIDSLVFPFVFKDSANGHATLSLRPGCTDHGTYTVKVHASDGIDTTTREFAVNIIDINYPPEFDTTSYYVAHEMVEFKTMIKVYDCDNPNPRIRIINAPKEAVFTDNNNGTGTFIWTPDADDNGFYMIIFEAQDDMTTVRDTIIIEITDVNAYPPDITVSVSDTMVPLNLPIVIYATAKDRDGTPTIIRASGLPSGAQFESDNNGTALVRWTPADTGIFKFDFIAIDAADTTIKVSKQVQLKVSNINVTGPKFSPVQDFIIDQNKQFTTTLEAHDPDGTIPVLHLKGGQQTDLTFTDNGNGTATVNWIPPCNVSGTFYVTVSASDQSFTDSITFAITVR
ncbi:MAG TPA: VWA domain-containing protein, partial [Chitinispirillaceae bacterium]|nr:VWA domain-containing protein [Chitinispirillaceae bacterium]